MNNLFGQALYGMDIPCRAWTGRSSQVKGCQPVIDLPVLHEDRETAQQGQGVS